MTALAGFPEMKFWPGGSGPTVTNFTLNQSADQLEFIFQCPEAITISRFGYRQGTLTGTAPVFIGSYQGVDGSGNPDGTVKGGGSPASATFTPTSGNNSTWLWQNLANNYSAARGEWLAMVLAYSSGTIDGSNNCSFAVTSAVGVTSGAPYGIQNDNGSRTRQTGYPLFGFGSSGTAYGVPISATISVSMSSISTPDERAILFNLPTTLCSSYKVIGAVIFGSFAAAGAFDLKLYDTDGTTVLAQTSFDTDQDEAATSNKTRPYYFDDSPATLVAGSTYRLSFVPTTNTHILAGLTVGANADMDAYPWGAAYATSSSRTDAGSWTDDAKTRYGINLILADITAPSGGGIVAPTMVLGGEGLFLGA